MKILKTVIIICLLAFWPADHARAELATADFSAQITQVASPTEADIQIISISQNDFKLLPSELIRVNFYPSETKQELAENQLLSGKLYYRQAEVDQELVDWYMVKDYELSPPPLLNSKTKALVLMGLALIAVAALLIAEKIRQKRQASIV